MQGFVEVSKLRPDRNMRETMGRRIAYLEELVSRAGAYLEGSENGETEVVQDVMAEAVRIRCYGLTTEKKKGGRASPRCPDPGMIH